MPGRMLAADGKHGPRWMTGVDFIKGHLPSGPWLVVGNPATTVDKE
jgi:hypothetical protein